MRRHEYAMKQIGFILGELMIWIKCLAEFLFYVLVGIALALLCLKGIIFLFDYRITAMLPDTPKHIGKESLNTVAVPSIEVETPLEMGEFQLPNLESDTFAQYLFGDFASLDMGAEQLSQKETLILKLFPYHQRESILPYVTVLVQLPIELLNIMVEDELYFIPSERTPVNGDRENQFVVAYYERQDNRIVLYNTSYAPNALMHEIGHWMESYLKRYVDFFYQYRIDEQMTQELASLGLTEENYQYAQTSIHEQFAVAFETFMNHYDVVKEKAPITFEYFQYYLIELLKTYK